jgi:hypothetical protein
MTYNLNDGALNLSRRSGDSASPSLNLRGTNNLNIASIGGGGGAIDPLVSNWVSRVEADGGTVASSTQIAATAFLSAIGTDIINAFLVADSGLNLLATDNATGLRQYLLRSGSLVMDTTFAGSYSLTSGVSFNSGLGQYIDAGFVSGSTGNTIFSQLVRFRSSTGLFLATYAGSAGSDGYGIGSDTSLALVGFYGGISLGDQQIPNNNTNAFASLTGSRGASKRTSVNGVFANGTNSTWNYPTTNTRLCATDSSNGVGVISFYAECRGTVLSDTQIETVRSALATFNTAIGRS